VSDFTTAQQAQIRLYLGYPSLFRYKNTRLEGVIAGTGVVDSDTVAIVVGILAQLAATDGLLLGTGGVAGDAAEAAGVKGVGKGAVEFFQGRQIKDLSAVGKVLAGRLSVTLGVPFYADSFGQEGYPGDKYSDEGLGRGSRGGGGLIPLG
jgi:hypothetical protein